MKTNITFLFYVTLLFCACNKERAIANSSSSEYSNSIFDSRDSEESASIQHEGAVVSTGIHAQLDKQTAKKPINNDSRLEIESVSVTTIDGEFWNIWKKVDANFIEKTNTTITTDIFGVPFGPINGFEDEQLRVGWNNRNVILYIEVLSNEVKTFDGITLGDSKKKVLDLLDSPIIEEDNQFRYHNTDFEMIGLIFHFENDIITKIYLFGYV